MPAPVVLVVAGVVAVVVEVLGREHVVELRTPRPVVTTSGLVLVVVHLYGRNRR